MCRRLPTARSGVPGWERLPCQQLWGSQPTQRATILWVRAMSSVDLWQLGRGEKHTVSTCLKVQGLDDHLVFITDFVWRFKSCLTYQLRFMVNIRQVLFLYEKKPLSFVSVFFSYLWNNLSSRCLQCTKPCGGGIKTRLVVCQRPNGERFNDLSCEIHDKPPDQEQCNTRPCPSNPHWSTDPWSSVRS